MKRLFFALVVLASNSLVAKDAKIIAYYGTGLCNYPPYKCIKISRGQTWKKLFPDPSQRDLVQRLNRTYNPLWAGKIIVIPKNLAAVNLFDLSPFSLKIPPSANKKIVVDQDKLAWAAYDEHGQLIKWGPISSGRNTCSDSANSCLTLTGAFQIFSKENADCVSNAFPAGRGGAKMPYCMFFHKGYALHGAEDIPGYRASHGCVRLFIDDAKWLNKEFVQVANEANRYSGTTVIVRPLVRGN